jgi:hypothetical protein
MKIRQAEERDSENFAKLIQDVERTTSFMLFDLEKGNSILSHKRI